jgi:hypothetical protein
MNLPWSLELPEGPGKTIPSRGSKWNVGNHLQAELSSSPVRLDCSLWEAVSHWPLAVGFQQPNTTNIAEYAQFTSFARATITTNFGWAVSR